MYKINQLGSIKMANPQKPTTKPGQKQQKPQTQPGKQYVQGQTTQTGRTNPSNTGSSWE